MAMLNEVPRRRACDEAESGSFFVRKLKSLFPWKGDSKKEIIRKAVYLTALLVLAVSAKDLYIYKFGDQKVDETKNELTEIFNSSNNNDGSADSDSNEPIDVPVDDSGKYPVGMLRKFEKLYDLNNEIVGWINIPGFQNDKGEDYINYPVLQTSDNDFYLTNDFYKEPSDAGAVFADYHERLTKDSVPDNIILYGHNMASGTFFNRLHEYKQGPEFVSEHNLIKFDSLYEEGEYVIFGAFLIGVYEYQDNVPLFAYHMCYDFETWDDWNYWYKNVMYRSYYNSGVECDENDEYLTLSTCSTEFDSSRWVIAARKLRDGETAEQYKGTYTNNEKYHRPYVMYQTYGGVEPDSDGPDY